MAFAIALTLDTIGVLRCIALASYVQNLTGFAFGLIFPAVVGLKTLFWLSVSALYLLKIALVWPCSDQRPCW